MTWAAKPTDSVPPALASFPEDEHTEPDRPWHLGAGAPFVTARMRMQARIVELKQALEMARPLELELASEELVASGRVLSAQYAALQHTPHRSEAVMRAARYEVKLFREAAASLLAESMEFAFAHSNPRLLDALCEHASVIREVLDQDLYLHPESRPGSER